MSNNDYQLTNEPSPILQVDESVTKSPEGVFWNNYHRLQDALTSADRVDLNVVNQKTGKVHTYQQVRFSLKNFYQRH